MKDDLDDEVIIPGSGAQAMLRVAWTFVLDKADSLLMLKALGGRLKQGEVSLAKDLGDRLTRQRVIDAKELYDRLQHHANNIGKEREPKEPTS